MVSADGHGPPITNPPPVLFFGDAVILVPPNGKPFAMTAQAAVETAWLLLRIARRAMHEQ